MTASHSTTTPESPATLEIQIQQLQDGIRNVVMFPKGTPVPGKARDIGMRDIVTGGNRFWFNPTKMKAGEISTAAKKDELPKILGHDGYGVPDKSKLNGPGIAVVAKSPAGETAQDIATDPQHLPGAIQGARRVTPPGGSVKVESPAKVIGDRLGKKGNESAEVFRGSSNIDLSPQGVQEAHDAAKRTVGQFTEIHASPLKRAQDTAKIIARSNPQAGAIKTTPALEPWFLGQHEGQAVTPERLADINDRIRNRPNDAVPGRGPQSSGPGESFNQFKDPLIQHVQNQIGGFKSGQKTLNVTHYRDVQAVKSWLKAGHPPNRAVDPNEMTRKGDQHPGDLYRLHPRDMRLMPTKDAKQDGIYFLRHGATAWNAENGGATPKVKPVDPNRARVEAMKEITRKAQSGDVHGALKSAAEHTAKGTITDSHAEKALDMAGPEALKAGFSAVPELHKAMKIFEDAKPEHRDILRPVMQKKLLDMEKHSPAQQQAVIAKLKESGLMPGR